MSEARAVLLSFLPAAVLALALVLLAPLPGWAAASLADGAPPALAVTLLVALAALHRPHGGALLGLGALGIAVGFESAAPLPTAVAVTVGAFAAEALRRPLERRRGAPLPERRGWLRVVERSTLAGVGTIAAGGVWIAAGELGSHLSLALVGACAAVVSLLPASLFELALRRLARGESWREAATALPPMAFDLAGWALGLLGVALLRLEPALGGATLVAFALLALEVARHDLRAEATGRTLAEAEKLSRSSATLVAGGSELERLALRIFGECAAIGAPSFLALELDAPESGAIRFWAAADGVAHVGEPDPPPYPPTLPGFHRREPWRIFEHTLVATSDRRALLRLWCDPRQLDPTAESSLAALLPQIQAAVREALVEREATIDRLTGAATRRALERRLAESFAGCRDEGRSLALVMADLDHFKRINDTHGHPVGDRVLQAVAAVLLAPMRGRDLCGRFGGEEFALLFEDTAGETALEIAERLRKKIEAIEIPLPNAPEGRVALTMSFGVAAVPALAVRSAQELVELADSALYTAKRLGRNVALLDCGGGQMRTGSGEAVEIGDGSPFRPPVFFA